MLKNVTVLSFQFNDSIYYGLKWNLLILQDVTDAAMPLAMIDIEFLFKMWLWFLTVCRGIRPQTGRKNGISFYNEEL